MVKPLKFFVAIVNCLILFSMNADAQSAIWEKEIPGKLIITRNTKKEDVNINNILSLVNRLICISQPKGFNVHQWFTTPTLENKVYKGRLYINFYRYYRFDKGPVLLQSSHPKSITISYNDPYDLMNEQSIFLSEESEKLGMPLLFTDTFPLVYTDINGFIVSQGLDTEFDSRVPVFVLNPKKTGYFRQLTNEEYYRFFIGKLDLDISRDTVTLNEGKSMLKEAASNKALASTLPELEKQHKAFSRWIAFLKKKKQWYEKNLAEMPAEQKKYPARFAAYAKPARMMDGNGNYLEEITGYVEYEPLHATDTIFTRPVFTFIKQPFDVKLPVGALQLLVIFHAYSQNEQAGIRELLDKCFFPLLPYRELASLMYK